MFKIGMRLMAVPGMRHVPLNVSTASRADRVPRSLFEHPKWERSSSRNWRLSSPLRTLSFVALAAGGSLHSQADDNEEDVAILEQTPVIRENNRSDDITCKTMSKRGKVFGLDIVEEILYERMDSANRTLFLGIMGANVAVYSAFALGFFFSRPPRRSPTFLRFLSRNFLLSLGWLSRGRWHVLFTSTLAHVSLSHLIGNTLVTFIGVWVCSQYLNVWQMAGLYFGGGLIGGVASMTLMKHLRKVRYLSYVAGGSCGDYAILSYYICAQNLELPSMPSVPFGLIFKAMFLYALVRQGVGLSKYIRYGRFGKVSTDYAGHLGGAVTGLLSYGISRVDVHNDESRRSPYGGTHTNRGSCRSRETTVKPD